MILKKLALIILITFHYFVVVCAVLSIFGSFSCFQWYIAVSLDTLLIRVVFSANTCPLTRLENKIRCILGFSLVSNSFLKDYVVYSNATLRKLIKELYK